MKDQKIKCQCGCSTTLYITELEKGVLCIGSEPNAKKGFKHFKGVVIDRKKLLNVIRSTR